MTMSHTNDKGLRKEGRKMTKGLPRKGKKITKERKEDYEGKEGRLPREERKITKGSKPFKLF